jgi:hypothetical protein
MDSILSVEIFDHKKANSKNQGFLGAIRYRIGDAFDLDVGGDSV